MKKIAKKEYYQALCGLILDSNEDRDIRVASFKHLFEISAAQVTKYVDKHPVPQAKNLPLAAIKQMVGLAYQAILKKLGKDDSHTLTVLKTAIEHLSEHELKLEWQAITDGTISSIVDTMLNWGEQSDRTKQDIQNIFEGLAVPYFRDYKGKVPKEDLEFAHQVVRDYFKGIKRTEPALKEGSKTLLLPAKKSR